MRKKADSASLAQKLSAELVGTFFVTLSSASVDILYYTGEQVDFVSRWLTRGFVTASLIYALSEISGAHINPVVSVAFAIRRTMRWSLAGGYCLAQFAGAFGAAALVKCVWPVQSALGASHPGMDWTHTAALCTEAILSFLVVGVILITADPQAAVGKQAALAVGFTVAACGFFGGPISGASMNPARSLTTQLFSGNYDIMWIYVVGPLTGAVAGAFAVFPLIGPPDVGERKIATGK